MRQPPSRRNVRRKRRLAEPGLVDPEIRPLFTPRSPVGGTSSRSVMLRSMATRFALLDLGMAEGPSSRGRRMPEYIPQVDSAAKAHEAGRAFLENPHRPVQIAPLRLAGRGSSRRQR